MWSRIETECISSLTARKWSGPVHIIFKKLNEDIVLYTVPNISDTHERHAEGSGDRRPTACLLEVQQTHSVAIRNRGLVGQGFRDEPSSPPLLHKPCCRVERGQQSACALSPRFCLPPVCDSWWA